MRKVLHKTIQPIHQCLGPSPGESQCDETVSSTIFQILCALDVSRKGLSEEDLINMFSISSNVWSPLYFALEQYLLKKSGLLWYCFFYYCPQTKFAKVMFIHPSVSHSVHRGGSASRGSASSGDGYVGCLHPEGGWVDPLHRILRDTANERAVRILLECILVLKYFEKVQNLDKRNWQRIDEHKVQNIKTVVVLSLGCAVYKYICALFSK